MDTKTLHYGACTINIRRPSLSDTERTEREQTAKHTLERIMRDYLNRKDARK